MYKTFGAFKSIPKWYLLMFQLEKIH